MKKQYLETLLKIFKDMGLTYIGTFGEVINFETLEDLGALLHLPEENVKLATELDYSNCKDYGDVYQLLGQSGVFKFEPYLRNDSSGTPTLTLRHNRHLHQFRGYYFQVSHTPEGIGDAGHGCYSMYYMKEAKRVLCQEHSDFLRFMYWCHMLGGASFIDNFMKLYKEQSELLPIFLNESTHVHGYSYDDLRKYWVVVDTFPEQDFDKVLNLSKRGELICRIGILTGTYFIVQTMFGGRLRNLQFTVTDESSDALAILEEFVDKKDIYTTILVAMLAVSGISVNYQGWFATEKLGRLSCVEPSPVENLSDIERSVGV